MVTCGAGVRVAGEYVLAERQRLEQALMECLGDGGSVREWEQTE